MTIYYDQWEKNALLIYLNLNGTLEYYVGHSKQLVPKVTSRIVNLNKSKNGKYKKNLK